MLYCWGFPHHKILFFFIIFSHEKYLDLCELLLLADKTWEVGSWKGGEGESRGGSFVALCWWRLLALPRDLRSASQAWCSWSRTRAAVASLSPWQCFLVSGTCSWGNWCWQAHLNKRFTAVWGWFGFAGARSDAGVMDAEPSSWTHRASPTGLVLLGVLHGNEVAGAC